ncbi:MAG TPA: hypothetical protein VKE88_02490, partial [Candidatus Nanoarchaeia archaeon]|nr:hypothetical protein [Candidatus Nanoarchaeia archaeon]
MATFLDAGLLSHFNVVFVFLFVLVAVYAILLKIKMFGDNQFVNGVIAFVMAVMFASSNTTAKVFSYATPWFVLLFLVLLVVQLMFSMMGGTDNIITANNPTTTSIVAIFILMIFFLSISQVTHENKQPLVDSGEIQEGEP